MSDICLISDSADISDICRYLSDIGHIWNLGSFTKAILLQKCSISLISPISLSDRDHLDQIGYTSYGQIYVRAHEHENFEASYTKSRFAAIIHRKIHVVDDNRKPVMNKKWDLYAANCQFNQQFNQMDLYFIPVLFFSYNEGRSEKVRGFGKITWFLPSPLSESVANAIPMKTTGSSV